jgi:glycerate kinase
VNTGIAPDSFKECLSVEAMATQIEAGFREVYPEAEFVKGPTADGGEETVAALQQRCFRVRSEYQGEEAS